MGDTRIIIGTGYVVVLHRLEGGIFLALKMVDIKSFIIAIRG
jgi:hypothetical protein